MAESEAQLGVPLVRAQSRLGVRSAALATLAGAAIVYGVVLRVVIYRSSIGFLQGDEAQWGLMARHVLHGEVSAFFWGQAYGGTVEIFPVAALFSIFGTHLVLMRIVPIAFSAVAGLIVWRIGRRELGETEGVVAALLLWIWPIYSLWKVEVWSGFYGGGLILTSLVLLLTLRLDRDPSRLNAALMGLVLGLALWESVQAAAVIVPALIWLTLRRPRVWLQTWVAVPAVVVGALPWILSNLRHDWWSFNSYGNGSSYIGRIHGFASSTFPMALGLRVPFSTAWIFGAALSLVVYAGVVATFGWLAWRSWKTPLSLLYLVIAGYPFLYALSGWTSNTGEARYVVVLLPAVVLVVASLARTLTRAAVILAVAAALSAVGLVRWIDHQDALAPTVPYNQGVVNVSPAIELLDRAGIDRAFADYWIATRVTFDTSERIVVSEADLGNLAVTAPGRVLPPQPTNFRTHHHPAYDTAVRSAPRHAYVFVQREPYQARDVGLLRRNGYRMYRAGTFIMLVSPAQDS